MTFVNGTKTYCEPHGYWNKCRDFMPAPET